MTAARRSYDRTSTLGSLWSPGVRFGALSSHRSVAQIRPSAICDLLMQSLPVQSVAVPVIMARTSNDVFLDLNRWIWASGHVGMGIRDHRAIVGEDCDGATMTRSSGGGSPNIGITKPPGP